MDVRQLVGLVLAIAGVLWLLVISRGSDEVGSSSLSGAQNSGQPFLRWLNAVAEKLPNRFLPGVILLILGALLLLPWNSVFGSDSTAPCCPPGALAGYLVVVLRAGLDPGASIRLNDS